MPIENLTDRRLKGLRHADGEIIDAKSGLSARADREGRVSFSFRYRVGNTRPRIQIGRYPGVLLADARIAALRIREQVRAGADPVAERNAAKAAASAELVFDELAALFIDRYAKKTKTTWRSDQLYLSREVLPHWAKRKVSSITRADAIRLLFEVSSRAPVAANRLKSVLSKLFSWAVDSALIDDNPMLGVKRPAKEGRGKSRTLSDLEIGVLWRVLDSAKAPPGVIAGLRLLMLLGQRSGEVRGMATGELHHLNDAQATYWELPPHRMKARKGHVVPLPPLARSVVQTELARPRGSEFVLSSGVKRMARNQLSQWLARIIDRMDDEGASLKRDRPTVHDLRRSVISGMARLGISRDDRMAVASHAHGDVHEVYDRYDRVREKRRALERWERHVLKFIAGRAASGAGIIALHQAVS